MEYVTWCRTSIRTAPPHSRPVSAVSIEPPISQPRLEREREAGQDPEQERPVDVGDERVLHQVWRVPLAVGALGVDEQPADVGVQQAAQRTVSVSLRAMRVALLVGEGMVLAMVGDPGDDRPLDRGGAEDRRASPAPTAWP